MRNNKKIISLSVLLMWLMCVPLFAYADNSDPTSMLRSVADQMIAGLKANKASLKKDPEVVYSLANRVVVPHADLDEMSRRVIPPKVWNSATSAQRAQFEKEFTRLLVRTYSSALSSYNDQVINFKPIFGGYAGKSTVEVKSEIISSDNPPLNVLYRLVQVGGQWKLFDMSVEGVSLIESFRSQFADILSQGNMDSLLKRLSGHNAR